jgi:hypothetical protein
MRGMKVKVMEQLFVLQNMTTHRKNTTTKPLNQNKMETNIDNREYYLWCIENDVIPYY